MEKLKDISLTRGESSFNISIDLTNGGAGTTFWKDDPAGIVIKRLELLIEKLKEGVLNRALG